MSKTFNNQTFDDLVAYRDEVPLPPVVMKRFNWALELYKPKSILDFGCGTGRYSAHLVNDYAVYGIEPVKKAMAKARERGILEWTGKPVDFVIMSEVIEHLADPMKELRTIYNALKPNGIMFLTTPNAAWWKHRISLLFGKVSYVQGGGYTAATTPHIRLWTFKTLIDTLKQAGFTVFPANKWGTYAGFKGGSFLMDCGLETLLSAGIVVVAKRNG